MCYTSAALGKYGFISEKKTWFEAQEYCLNRSGELASAASGEDMNDMTEVSGGKESWLGLNDLNSDTMDLYPNSWKWSTQTESRSGYMNFAASEPNNAGGVEECVTVLVDGAWNDKECSYSLNFVCFSGKGKTITHTHAHTPAYRPTTHTHTEKNKHAGKNS